MMFARKTLTRRLAVRRTTSNHQFFSHKPPQLQPNTDGIVEVSSWGVAGGMVLCPGDRLVLGEAIGHVLLVLKPRGRGAMMLGRMGRRGQLLAEPGGVPASLVRWQVVGGVIAVERPIESGLLDLKAWHLSTMQRNTLQSLPGVGVHGGLKATRLELLLSQIRRLKDPPGLVLSRVECDDDLRPPPSGWVRYELAAPPQNVPVVMGKPLKRSMVDAA